MSMIGQTKIHRYWRGKAPDWAEEAEEDADLRQTLTSSSNRKRKFIDDINSADDPRLRRLADSRAVDRDEIRADHRRIRQAEIVSTAEDDAAMEDEEEDEDAVEEKRGRIRERLLKLRREEDEDAVSSVEDEEESEYETDSEEEEEEEAIRRAMAKPVYVLKHERETIAERERLEAVMQALVEAEKWKIAERKPETKQIVVEMIREDYEIQESLIEKAADVGDVDTDDETNEVEEYESWKAREIARIKRDRVRRNMTEEERKKPSSAPKKKWKFLQTYHHKGAYFQSDPDGGSGGSMDSYAIYWRDLSAPTGDDKLNKSILPKVMQVKNFGRSGRTKWTHLVNEDTTDWTTPWANNDPLRSKYNAKMGGMNRPIAKPKGSKKLKTGSSLEFWPS
ncbi:uncharacterized protein LOC141598568 [Silene latifolia]|uniref:uncharacterized protein LOC141598568 n=1 Tax=Silene latifolia TaxID=37657 RepID=UPI003D77FEB9